EADLGEDPEDPVGKPGILELTGRYVDRQNQRIVPVARLLQRLMEDRFEQISNQAGFLRNRNEEVGADDTASWMVPACERLETTELSGPQVILRLVIRGELTERNAAPESAFDLVARPEY